MVDPPVSWPRPLRLLALLLSLGEREQAAARLAVEMAPHEWRHFVHLVIERHRVAPLVAGAAPAGLPDEVSDEIREAARRAAVDALRQKAETVRLWQHFRSTGVDPVLLKGWALAERLYGSASARQGRDIDLLVCDEQFGRACEALAKADYAADPSVLDMFCRHPAARAAGKDVEFHRAGQAFTVELHARSNAYRAWPSLLDLPGGLAVHPIDRTDLKVSVPSPRGDLVYLAVHGIQHVYSRLRWLHDVGRLLEIRPAAALSEDLAAARAIAADRFVRVSAALAGVVFGAPWPPGWRPLATSERMAVRLILSAVADDDFAGHGRRAALRRVALKALVAKTARQKASLLRGAGIVVLAGRRE